MNKNLEKEYKNYIESDLPDLWSRIEMALPEKSNNEANSGKINENEGIINKSIDTKDCEVVDFNEDIEKRQANNNSKRKKKSKQQWIGIMSGVAAAILVVSVSYKLFVNGDKFTSNSTMNSDCAPSAMNEEACYESDTCTESACEEECADACEGADYFDNEGSVVKNSANFGTSERSKSNSNSNSVTADEDMALPDEAECDEMESSAKSVLECYDDKDMKLYLYCEEVNVLVNSISNVDGTTLASVTLIDNYGDILKSGDTINVNVSNVASSVANEEELKALEGQNVTWRICLNDNDEWYVLGTEFLEENN